MRTTPQSGMNIFDLMWSVLFVSGAVFGASFGYTHFGAWGAVLGVQLGGGIGYLASFAAAFLLAVIFKCFFGGTIFPPRKKKEKS